ncbi:MAG: hypothetical protein J1E64_15510 [Acetatifactor sp.]|nr:hypothetical protein [Acetatifactor sp.]
MKKVKEKAFAHGKQKVSCYHLHEFAKQYDEILKTAYEENSLPEISAKKRGRRKKEQSIKFDLQTGELQGIGLLGHNKSLTTTESILSQLSERRWLGTQISYLGKKVLNSYKI